MSLSILCDIIWIEGAPTKPLSPRTQETDKKRRFGEGLKFGRFLVLSADFLSVDEALYCKFSSSESSSYVMIREFLSPINIKVSHI